MAKRFKFHCPFWLASMERQEEFIKRKLLQKQKEKEAMIQPPPLPPNQPIQISLDTSMMGMDVPLMQIPLQVSTDSTVMVVEPPRPGYQHIVPEPTTVAPNLAIPGTSTSDDYVLPDSQDVPQLSPTPVIVVKSSAALKRALGKATSSKNEPPRKVEKKEYACETCDFSTNDKYHLRNHIKKNHIDVFESWKKVEPTDPFLTCGKNFYCQFCSCKTVVPEFMDWHYKNCHGDSAVAEVLEFDNKRIRFRCKPCNKTYKEMQFLAPHLSIRHNVNLPFECDICHQYFITRNKMMIHKTEHEGVLKSFNCDQCSEKFLRECDLKLHVFTEHELTEAQYKCDMCEKAFKTETLLLRHISYYHKNERPFQCEKCTTQVRTFRRKCDLDRHNNLVHVTKKMKEKAFQCDLCQKLFTTGQGRYNHKQLVHGLYIEEKVFSCDFCGATFNREMYYKNHMKKNHTGKVLKCEECGLLIRGTNDSLKKHMEKRHPYLNHK